MTKNTTIGTFEKLERFVLVGNSVEGSVTAAGWAKPTGIDSTKIQPSLISADSGDLSIWRTEHAGAN